jgi:hypothetical protein
MNGGSPYLQLAQQKEKTNYEAIDFRIGIHGCGIYSNLKLKSFRNQQT